MLSALLKTAGLGTIHPQPIIVRSKGWENTYSSGDFYYQKAWFIRMQNITLGYTLPKHLLAKNQSYLNLRIHASVNNAFTITPYDGLRS